MPFFNDMGKRPNEKYSIDRKNNNMGYFKDNCKWGTAKAQANNKCTNHSITINGTTKTIAQWSRFVGLNRSTIFDRIQSGWVPTKAIFQPKHNNSKLITIDDVTKTAVQWSKITGIRPRVVYKRLNRGWSPQKAVFTPVKHKNP